MTSSVLGQRLGKYSLVRLLGAGGMGEVYLARVEGAGGFSREVAIKLVPPAALASSSKALERFLREARLLAALSHRNIIGVFELDTSVDGRPFLVMERLRGVDLRELLKSNARAPLPWQAATFIGAEVARALAAAHDLRGEETPKGVLHGDLSPSNVMLCFDGAVKVLDFGLARACGAETTTVGIQGKLPYLSPEALTGVPVDHRADLFALGVMLYRSLTGALPHAMTNDPEAMRRARLAKVDPPSTRAQGLPAAVEAVVLRALSADRGQRVRSATELADTLEAGLAGAFGPADLAALLEARGLASVAEPSAPAGVGGDLTATTEWVSGEGGADDRRTLSDAPIGPAPIGPAPIGPAPIGSAVADAALRETEVGSTAPRSLVLPPVVERPAPPMTGGPAARSRGALGLGVGLVLLGALTSVAVGVMLRPDAVAPPAAIAIAPLDARAAPAADAAVAPAADLALAAVDVVDAAVEVVLVRPRTASVKPIRKARARPRVRRPRRRTHQRRATKKASKSRGRTKRTERRGIAPGQLADPFGAERKGR